MIKQKGFSLVEVIFAIGILVLVITAVIGLVVKTTGIKSAELQRKKASQMSEVVIENLLEHKNENPDEFWQFTADIGSSKTITGYDGYFYSVNLESVECKTGFRCANATIMVSWGKDQNFTVERFFSDKIIL